MEDLESLVHRIAENERKGRVLDIPSDLRNTYLHEVTTYAGDYLDGLDRRKAYESEGYERTEEDRELEVGESGIDMSSILHYIERRVDTTGLNAASGGHLGYIPGGGLPASAFGDHLAAVTNRYAGNFFSSPGAVRVENALIDWVGRLVGYAPGFGGNLASGGSMANLIGIAAARTAKGLKGKDLDRTVVYVSQQAHHSVPKALRITGMEECIVRRIALDDRYRMDPVTLRKQVEADKREGLDPFLLIANAGSTDVGAVDPLTALADVAQEHALWFHVDAAYGGFFLLTEHGKHVLAGIDRADSVVLDPHKGLFLPYGLGMIVVKDIRHLLKANGFEANYMQDTKEQAMEYSSADLSPELSKHFRGLRMWLPLKLHGVAPFRACLEEKLLLARYFRTRVQALGFEVGPEPELSVVIFRFVPRDMDADTFNKELAHAIQRDGRIFISTTALNGKFVLRMAVLSFRSHRKEIDTLLEILEAYVQQSAGAGRSNA